MDGMASIQPARSRLLSRENFAPAQWNDWQWHMANAITTEAELARWINVTAEESEAIRAVSGTYRWRVTPYYASLMDKGDPACPIRLQALPSRDELLSFNGVDVDPFGDRADRATNRVIHRYRDRVVFLVTQTCPVYCRHCTRKFHTMSEDGTYFGKGEGEALDEDFAYLAAHPEIREVLLSGGDPLTYSDRRLDDILSRLRAIPHIEVIRFGSRYPVLLPQRITPEFCAMIERYHPVWFSTHFNHPRELTAEAQAACDRLLRHGVPVQNQTVLLKGVNDDNATMRELMLGLVNARVKPYYLFHCDNVEGVAHFMTTIEKGQDIVASLVGQVSGYAVPRYVITTPDSKLPIERGYLADRDGHLVIEDRTGDILDLPKELYGEPGRRRFAAHG